MIEQSNNSGTGECVVVPFLPELRKKLGVSLSPPDDR
jgi:hypothetical protein